MDIDEKEILKRNQLLTFGVITVLILTGVYILYPEESTSDNPPFKLYTNNKNLLSGSYFVELDDAEDEEWQFQAALGFIPAIMGQTILGDANKNPLVFSTTPDVPTPMKKYSDLQPTIQISDLGENANSATIEIATTYWSTINTIVIASNYENALLVTPLAVELNLPIIIDGGKTENFIRNENIKSAITVGNVEEYSGIGLKQMEGINAIWEMYMEILDQNSKACDYIVVTNPYDIDYDNSNLYLPGLSLASGVLAAGHNALIVTGDYTINLTWIQQLGYGLGDAGSGERGADEDTITDEEELALQKSINNRAREIDEDIDMAVEFLRSYEHTAKFVGLVGGPAALPMLYLKSPIWYEEVDQDEWGEEYVATDTYYGDTDIKLKSEEELDKNYNYEYNSEDLYDQEMAVGRIVAQNLRDASALVLRSLAYWEHEFDSPEILEINHWSRQALIVTSLMTGDSDNMAAQHQREVFADNLMKTNEYDPTRIAATSGSMWLDDVKEKMEKVNGIIYDGHGYPDGWYHMWTSTGDEDADWDVIGAEDINELTLHAIPVFGACCLSSALDWPAVGAGGSNEEEMTPDNCMSLAFIHAGAICYIGATEESWGSFFGGLIDEDLDAWGYGDFDLPTMFWQYLLEYNMEIGWALNEAKDLFLNEIWTDQASKPFAYLCMLETVLYGDPAAMNGHPGFSK